MLKAHGVSLVDTPATEGGPHSLVQTIECDRRPFGIEAHTFVPRPDEPVS